jgi:putative phosphoribosyl transferase
LKRHEVILNGELTSYKAVYIVSLSREAWSGGDGQMCSSPVNVGKRVLRRLRRPIPEFKDRKDAGEQLVALVRLRPADRPIVLTLPRGGVPVGEPLAKASGAPLDVVVARKLPVPTSPEQVFGAITSDGSVVLNDRYLRYLPLTRNEIDAITLQVHNEVIRRETVYRPSGKPLDVRGRSVYLVDDGLATGYTMMAAAKMLREMTPKSLILAVPCSPADSLETVCPYFDELFCLVAQESGPFAVASFYWDFHDLSDEEVLEILRRTASASGAQG